MKKLIGHDIGTYLFDASTKIITFQGLLELTLEQILLITNVVNNTIIYNFADISKGGLLTKVGNDYLLTLTFDTTSMNNTDALQIYIDYRLDNISIYPQIPVNKTEIYKLVYKEISGTKDLDYLIPNGQLLTIQMFMVDFENEESSLELWYDINGTGIDMILIMAFFHSNIYYFNETFIGNGISKIKLRGKRFTGGGSWMYGMWRGYY